jgi:hypothetical protein
MSERVNKCAEIGKLFVGQYYPHLVTSPDTAYNFYHQDASISRIYLSNSCETDTGLDKIKAIIAQSNYQNSKFFIDSIDCQERRKGEIIVMVTGVVIGPDKVVRRFCQTFFLEATAGSNRYVVRNDLLRFLSPQLMNIGEPCETKVEPTPTDIEQNCPVPELKETVVDNQAPAMLDAPLPESMLEEPAKLDDQSHKASTSEIKAEEVETVSDLKVVVPKVNRQWAHVAAGMSGQNVVTSESVSASASSPVQDHKVDTEPAAVGKSVPARRTYVPSSAPELVPGSVFVSNLPIPCDAEEIKTIFARYGKIKNVKVTPDKPFCFVDFEQLDSVEKVLQEKIKVRDVEVKLDRRKAARPFDNTRGRGRGRGGRGAGPGRDRDAPRGEGATPRGRREDRGENKSADRSDKPDRGGRGGPRKTRGASDRP